MDGSATKDSQSGSSNNSSERKRRLSFSVSPSNDSEKVSIVRAAGTFFPQNCEDEVDSSPTDVRRKSKESNTSDISTTTSKKCHIPYCNQANDSHIHCVDCSEVCISSIQRRLLQNRKSTNLLNS